MLAHDPAKSSVPAADIERRAETSPSDTSLHDRIEYVRARVVTVLTQCRNPRWARPGPGRYPELPGEGATSRWPTIGVANALCSARLNDSSVRGKLHVLTVIEE